MNISCHPIEASDFDLLHSILMADGVTDFDNAPYTAEKSLEHLEWIVELQSKSGFRVWKVADAASGAVVGLAGITPRRLECAKYIWHPVEISYIILPRYRNNNFATAAAAYSLGYAFSTLQLPEAVALIAPDNLPSLRVARKNGMVFLEEYSHGEVVYHIYVKKNPAFSDQS